MRTGQNKNWRGRHPSGQSKQWKRSRSPAHEAHNRFYESNGPDVKGAGIGISGRREIFAVARDAQVSGDLIAAEGYQAKLPVGQHA
jgi:Domain of unknown function (DUF4167)